jgi:hypothetical protein
VRLDHVCTQHFAFHLESLQDPPHPFAAVGVAPKELPWVLWVQGLVHGVAMQGLLSTVALWLWSCHKTGCNTPGTCLPMPNVVATKQQVSVLECCLNRFGSCTAVCQHSGCRRKGSVDGAEHWEWFPLAWTWPWRRW